MKKFIAHNSKHVRVNSSQADIPAWRKHWLKGSIVEMNLQTFGNNSMTPEVSPLDCETTLFHRSGTRILKKRSQPKANICPQFASPRHPANVLAACASMIAKMLSNIRRGEKGVFPWPSLLVFRLVLSHKRSQCLRSSWKAKRETGWRAPTKISTREPAIFPKHLACKR